MQLYVIDTETCGLTGPVVLIQYRLIDTTKTDKNNEKIVLHDVWGVPIRETMDLIEQFCAVGVIYFNGAFDHFHLQKLYNCLDELGNEVGYDALPEDYINEYAMLEPQARDGLCIKPAHCLDLFLYARKGPLQSVSMNRGNIIIKRVPSCLAPALQKRLEEIIEIDSVYFARRKEYKEYSWDVEVCKEDPLFSNLTLRFKPSVALKTLATHVLDFDSALTMADVSPGSYPLEYGWAPFALATCPGGGSVGWRCKIKSAQGYKRGYAWPGVIRHHISHWRYHKYARQYARDDITYTRDLYYHFRDEENSTLKIDDDDSVLAAQVGSSRWRGYAINVPGIKELRKAAISESEKAPKAPKKVFEHISPHLSESELNTLGGSTKRTVLEALAKSFEPCMMCLGTGVAGGVLGDMAVSMGMSPDASNMMTIIDEWSGQPKEVQKPCPDCNGTGHTNQPHPAAKPAQECLDARKAQKEVELYDKLLQAGRFHASFKVIGTFTSRMSGADGLNPQGIKHDKFVREMFPLSFGNLELVGGDFMSFEVSIIDSICKDEKLRTELCRCAECKGVWPLDKFATQIDCPFCGKRDGNEPCRQKFHGLFGMGLEPGSTYDDVIKSKGTDNDLYDKGKRSGFSQFYGGDYHTIVERIGVSEDVAIACVEWFEEEFSGSRKFRDDIHDKFCSMRQDDGIGTQVEWHDPAPYVESLLGHKRYFSLENKICKKLFDLANKLPPNWKEIKGTCMRREREQTMAGAMMSALYAAAFNIQAKNLRAASNHVIQSTGATITKDLQCRLWSLQPVGVADWKVQPLNVHDEIMLPIDITLKNKAVEIVDQLVQDYRELIPLIAIGWSSDMKTWADK